MATRCDSVILKGVFRSVAAAALFTRQANGDWMLMLDLGDKREEFTFNKRDRVKPCWTVACGYFAKMTPEKPASEKRAKYQEQAAKELRDAGHVVKFKKLER